MSLPRPFGAYETPEISIVPFDPPFPWVGCLVTKKGRYVSKASRTLIDSIVGKISEMRSEKY